MPVLPRVGGRRRHLRPAVRRPRRRSWWRSRSAVASSFQSLIAGPAIRRAREPAGDARAAPGSSSTTLGITGRPRASPSTRPPPGFAAVAGDQVGAVTNLAAREPGHHRQPADGRVPVGVHPHRQGQDHRLLPPPRTAPLRGRGAAAPDERLVLVRWLHAGPGHPGRGAGPRGRRRRHGAGHPLLAGHGGHRGHPPDDPVLRTVRVLGAAGGRGGR